MINTRRYTLAIFSPYIVAAVYFIFFRLELSLWLLPVLASILIYYFGTFSLMLLFPVLIWPSTELFDTVSTASDHHVTENIRSWLSSNMMTGESDIGYVRNLKSVIMAITIYPSTIIDQRIKDLFKHSGTMHLLVISGLHFSIIAKYLSSLSRIIALPLARLCGNSSYIKSYNLLVNVIAAILILFYGIMISGSVPAIRALAASLIAMGLRYTGRYYDGYLFLHLIASGMIIYRPELMFSPSFQLSFIITAVVLHTGREELKDWKEKMAAYFADAMRVNFASLILSALIFAECATYSLIANIIVVPIFCALVLPASILAMLLCFKLKFINMIAVWLLHLCINLVGLVELLPMSHFRIDSRVIWLLAPLLIIYEYYVVQVRSRKLLKKLEAAL